MDMMKCAMSGTQQVRKYSHNIIPLVHTLPFTEITVSPQTIDTMEKCTWHEVCLLFSVYNFCSRHSSCLYSLSQKHPISM